MVPRAVCLGGAPEHEDLVRPRWHQASGGPDSDRKALNRIQPEGEWQVSCVLEEDHLVTRLSQGREHLGEEEGARDLRRNVCNGYDQNARVR